MNDTEIQAHKRSRTKYALGNAFLVLPSIWIWFFILDTLIFPYAGEMGIIALYFGLGTVVVTFIISFWLTSRTKEKNLLIIRLTCVAICLVGIVILGRESARGIAELT